MTIVLLVFKCVLVYIGETYEILIGKDLFFKLAIADLQSSKFFEGPDSDKVFTHDISLVERHQYRVVGRLVALALVQEGPGLQFLNNYLFDLMVGLDVNLSAVDVHMPGDLNVIIQQLKEVDTEEKRDIFLSDHGDCLVNKGINNIYRMQIDKKDEILHILKKQYIYYRTSSEISQFIEGMNEVGNAWDHIRSHADLFKPLFCYKQTALNADDISSLFKVSYSEEGSNARRQEDVTIYAWELFLQSIEERDVPVTFSELLAFSTGSDQIPPCGFEKQIDILFYNQESDSIRLPFVSTCGLQIWLPRNDNPESFSRLLVRAVKESAGFLKV